VASWLVDNSMLMHWRTLDAAQALVRLADFAKQDASYVPTTSLQTSRWHVRFGAREFELLCTGPKFYDTRAGMGGGGAVDLLIHCMSLDFKAAVRYLLERNL